MRPSGMGKKGALTLLGASVVIGLASLALGFRDPSSFGAWGTAVGMACLAIAQIIRLRDLNKRGG
jgi:membrane associated rhomboid family serine protease